MASNRDPVPTFGIGQNSIRVKFRVETAFCSAHELMQVVANLPHTHLFKFDSPPPGSPAI